MLKVGDKVKVIKSPYYGVKAGTITTVANIVNAQFGKRWTIYILDTAVGGSFYEWELEKIDAQDNN